MAGNPRKIRVVGDPVLSTPCRPVDDFGPGLAQLIEDMFASMYVAEGVGLAAPQIGVDLAVFVFDCLDAQGVPHVGHAVNPVLVSTAGPIDDGDEGCLSVPGPYYPTPRPSVATVRAVDKSGAPFEITGSGFFGRCLQHEIEHLAGTLYIDHLPRNRRRRVLRDIEPFEWNAPVATN